MAETILTNSLTRKKEKFVPINSNEVGMYTCGPTVYDYPTIGNWRTYVFGDLVNRTFKYFGYKVKYVMNLTDVGHLTGDNLGNADTGKDRLEEASKKEGKTAWEISEFYSKDFLESFPKLNILMPNTIAKATDHIKEQIELIVKLEEAGLTYQIDDGVYFNVKNFENKGYKYGELSTLDKIKEGARVEINPQKKDPRDFALWKLSQSFEGKRQMEWQSPWGVGFPGWHIECSAMSMKYLGESFDIHIGGEDLRSTHHPNEIAQSEGATGKKFVKYWLHGAFLTVDGGRMGKSLGNAYTLADVAKKGFDTLSLRYFYLTGHYKSQLNFTWESLKASDQALRNLKDHLQTFKANSSRTILSEEKRDKTQKLKNDFVDSVCDDFNIPKALSVVWQTVKSNIPSEDKYDLLIDFDQVLGLGLSDISDVMDDIPDTIKNLVNKREEFRKELNYQKADEIRKEIDSLGYVLDDLPTGIKIRKKR